MKSKLSRQLFLLFSFVIILSLLFFLFILSSRLEFEYEKNKIQSLNDFVTYSENSWKNSNKPIDSPYNYFYGNINSNEWYASDNIIFDNLEIKKILDNVKNQEKDITISSIYKQGNTSYFVVSHINDDGTYMVAIDHKAKFAGFKSREFIIFTVIFGLVLLWGNSIISIWSQQIVSRLKKIQKEVLTLSSSQYQNKIEAIGDDEITELASSIENMRLEIYKNEKIKREMLQNISHDIKTPIAVIKSYAEAIYDGVEGKEGVEIIIKQAEILKNKAYQLIEYTKLEYLELEKEFESVNMKELIENIIDYYRFQTSVTFDLKLENIYFKGFIENYRTVITNIIDNAIRYAKTKIIIELKENYLSIYNDGVNIEEELIDSIFKPYEKGNKGQFGLGMAIVKRTLDLFGYKISVINHDIGVSFIINN